METVNEIRDRLRINIENDLGEKITSNNAYAVAEINAHALMLYSLQLYGEQIRQDSFIDTATEKGLEGWGNTVNLPRRPATATVIRCSGKAVVDNDTNEILSEYDDILDIMQRRDGVRYKITEYYTNRSPGTDLVNAPLLRSYDYTLTCMTPGVVGNNININDNLFSDLLPESEWDMTFVTMKEIITPGTEEEGLEEWRARIKSNITGYPVIGTVSWYHSIALENEKITHAYPYSSKDNPGQVVVYVVARIYPVDFQKPEEIEEETLDELKKEFKSRNLLWGGDGTLGVDPVDVKNTKFKVDHYVQVVGLTIPGNALTDRRTVEDGITYRIVDYFATREPYITGISVTKNDVVNVNDIAAIANNYLIELDEGGTFTRVELRKRTDNTVVNNYVLGEGEITGPESINFSV